MRKNILLGIALLLFVFQTGCEKSMAQYNSNGISVRPSITINEDVHLQYICETSGYEIYAINLEYIYFVDINANQIELEEALSENLLTMEDILSVCDKQSQNDSNVYIGENYKIIQKDSTYLFAPKDYE